MLPALRADRVDAAEHDVVDGLRVDAAAGDQGRDHVGAEIGMDERRAARRRGRSTAVRAASTMMASGMGLFLRTWTEPPWRCAVGVWVDRPAGRAGDAIPPTRRSRLGDATERIDRYWSAICWAASELFGAKLAAAGGPDRVAEEVVGDAGIEVAAAEPLLAIPGGGCRARPRRTRWRASSTW